jgi:hypothetical protein
MITETEEKLQELVDMTIEEQGSKKDEPDLYSAEWGRGWDDAMECVRLEICNMEEGFEPDND